MIQKTYTIKVLFANIATIIEQIVAECVQFDEHNSKIGDTKKTRNFLNYTMIIIK